MALDSPDRYAYTCSLYVCMELCMYTCMFIDVDFGGQPWHICPPITEKRPCIYRFLPPSASPIFWFAHPIGLLLTSLRQCVCYICMLVHTVIHTHTCMYAIFMHIYTHT